jgi:hypothetical protein
MDQLKQKKIMVTWKNKKEQSKKQKKWTKVRFQPIKYERTNHKRKMT